LALARYQAVQGAGKPTWLNCYELFPWEDWRAGRPVLLDDVIFPALDEWLAESGPGELATRRERAELTFGLGHARWDPVRVLDRYELAYELKLVREAIFPGPEGLPGSEGLPRPEAIPGSEASTQLESRSRTVQNRAKGAGASARPGARAAAIASSGGGAGSGGGGPGLGRPLVLDHRRIAAAALERLRGKLAYRPVVHPVAAPAGGVGARRPGAAQTELSPPGCLGQPGRTDGRV
jgi:hypothetical protein